MTGTLEGEAIEVGRRLFAAESRFLRGVVALDQLPPFDLPEICFAGRSNVGKSSLLNALTGRNSLARTSNTPGRTQELNFFELGGRLIMVDLPGYGFAKAPKPKVDAWTALLKAYLQGRPSLREACLLIDSRHGFKENDQEIMALLASAAVPFRVVLTKIDLIKPSALDRLTDQISADLAKRPAALPEPIATSAAKGRGVPELRAVLAMHATRSAESETDHP
ncbi:MAG: ribosome biogenesis GTP-binding protein YihA/YsxC [Geminicoccaceae bacterium]